MSFTFNLPAPEGTRFEPGAFANQVGKTISLKFESGVDTAEMRGEIVSAVVSADGLFAEITVQPGGDPVMIDVERS